MKNNDIKSAALYAAGVALAIAGFFLADVQISSCLIIVAWILSIFPTLTGSRKKQRVLIILTFVIPLAVISRITDNAEKLELEQRKGVLQPKKSFFFIPSDEPLPKTNCSFGNSQLVIYLGKQSGTAIRVDSFPQVIIGTQYGQEILSVNRSKAGELLFSGTVFDKAGDVAARIKDNVFVVSLSAFPVRSDRSKLVVDDRSGRRVLDIQVLRHNAIVVTGVFNLPGAMPVTIGEEAIVIATNTQKGICISGEGRVAVMIR